MGPNLTSSKLGSETTVSIHMGGIKAFKRFKKLEKSGLKELMEIKS